MTPTNIIAWIIVGAIAGILADAVIKSIHLGLFGKDHRRNLRRIPGRVALRSAGYCLFARAGRADYCRLHWSGDSTADLERNSPQVTILIKSIPLIPPSFEPP